MFVQGCTRDDSLPCPVLCPDFAQGHGYAARVYTISHAARLTGVPAATLRVWERRYGLVSPIRTDGGYRLYDEHALQVVRAMSSLVAAGWAPRQAADHLLSEDGGAAPTSAVPARPTLDGVGDGERE